MKRKLTLLFYSAVISGCFTVQTRFIRVYTQHMFQEHLNHEMKESRASYWVPRDEIVTFISRSYTRFELEVQSS